MDNIIVAGIGTDVGKTVTSAILVTLFQGDYWKPVQSGCQNPDTQMIQQWIDPLKHLIHPPAYSLKAPLSPHHAAHLEKISIDPTTIIPPQTERTLIIEMIGGVLVPLNNDTLTLDLFCSWDAKWIIVSNHYLGSINHTLLTIEAIKSRGISLIGIVFNGESHSKSEEAILEFSNLPIFGRLFPEKNIHPSTIKRYAKQWQSGIHSHK